MRLRTLLTTAVVSTLIAGVTGMTAQATPASSPARAGTVTTWGNAGNAGAAAAMAVPGDLTGPVAALAATSRSTAAVTADGRLRVWGLGSAMEVTDAPTDVTDAVAVALSMNAGAVLHRDGTVTGWGSTGVADVPEGLKAKAISIQTNGPAYAVTATGELVTWGSAVQFPTPGGLTGLVDVAAGNFHVTALKADGTIVVWRYESADPDEEAALAPLTDVPDFGGKKVTAIDTSSMASGVILDDGTVELWGSVVPGPTPSFGSAKVVSLDVADINAGAVTDDGVVRTWGPQPAINSHPASLAGKPVAAIVLGSMHAAVIVTTFRELAKPAVAGTPQVGQTLTATPATFSLPPDSAATGQWYAGADPIAGQTGTTLKLVDAMVGKSISYRSTATRGAETITSASNEVGPVTAAPVVPTKVASTTALSVAPATGEFGTVRTATATVAKTGGTPTGTVVFKVGATEATATLANGTATWALPKTLAVGTHSVTATYSGDAATNASASAAVPVTVAKAASKVAAGKAKIKGKTKKVAKKVTLSITVDTADGVSPAGKVTVALKGKTKKKVTVSVDADGTAKVTFKKVKRGKYKAKLAYAGNATVAASTATAKLKI